MQQQSPFMSSETTKPHPQQRYIVLIPPKPQSNATGTHLASSLLLQKAPPKPNCCFSEKALMGFSGNLDQP